MGPLGRTEGKGGSWEEDGGKGVLPQGSVLPGTSGTAPRQGTCLCPQPFPKPSVLQVGAQLPREGWRWRVLTWGQSGVGVRRARTGVAQRKTNQLIYFHFLLCGGFYPKEH